MFCANVVPYTHNILATPTERDLYFLFSHLKQAANKLVRSRSSTRVRIPPIMQVKRESDKCAVLQKYLVPLAS